MYAYIKALHIIFVITWFAGLFYIVRLLVYTAEAQAKNSTERSILTAQFLLMQRRLWYGITWPSALLTLLFGTWMYMLWPAPDVWLYVKIGMVFFLYVYHFITHFIFLQQQKGLYAWGSFQLRLWNEVATIFLVAIVFLVVAKSTLSMLWGMVGLALLTIGLVLAIFIYKKFRSKSSEKVQS